MTPLRSDQSDDDSFVRCESRGFLSFINMYNKCNHFDAVIASFVSYIIVSRMDVSSNSALIYML